MASILSRPQCVKDKHPTVLTAVELMDRNISVLHKWETSHSTTFRSKVLDFLDHATWLANLRYQGMHGTCIHIYISVYKHTYMGAHALFKLFHGKTKQIFNTKLQLAILDQSYTRVITKYDKKYNSEQFCGLVQKRRNSIANALGLRLSCTNPSMCPRQWWTCHHLSHREQWWSFSTTL